MGEEVAIGGVLVFVEARWMGMFVFVDEDGEATEIQDLDVIASCFG
jgi:hypothetical protein